MADVFKKQMGTGWLAAGESSWWNWKIPFDAVWSFWADPLWLEGVQREFRVVETRSRVKPDGKRWARVLVKNTGTTDGYYALNVSEVI